MRGALRRVARTLGLEVRRVRSSHLPRLADCRLAGEAFRFWIANPHASKWWGTGEIPLDAEMRFLRGAVAPGAVVLEVGAHHGMHSVQMARWAGPTGRVHAFELSPENALVLCANANINALANLTVIPRAVGAGTEFLERQGERVVPLPGGDRSLALDEYVTQESVTRVDLLKVDVEGYEARVLEGARAVLAMRPHLSIELHLDDLGRYGSSLEEVWNLVSWDDYEVSWMKRPNWDEVQLLASPRDLAETVGVVNLFCRSRSKTTSVTQR